MQWWPHWTLKSRYQNCSLFHGHWRACANLGRVHAWLHHQGGGRLGVWGDLWVGVGSMRRRMGISARHAPCQPASGAVHLWAARERTLPCIQYITHISYSQYNIHCTYMCSALNSTKRI